MNKKRKQVKKRGPAKTAKERNQHYRERQKSKGLKRISLWVPLEKIVELKEVLKKIILNRSN